MQVLPELRLSVILMFMTCGAPGLPAGLGTVKEGDSDAY